MSHHDLVILGAGMTGLAAGIASGAPVYEANSYPGGICSSYAVLPGSLQKGQDLLRSEDAYRFDIGGGHWIFGGDPAIQRAIKRAAPVDAHERSSSVYFPESRLYVPYPLQNHLRFLGNAKAARALSEMTTPAPSHGRTMRDWLSNSFGPTLTELFFGPFHELYTAGLWTSIAPQDGFKSPVSLELAIMGAFQDVPAAGYNATFLYPREGMDGLVRGLAARCTIHYGKQAVGIDVSKRNIGFSDGSTVHYGRLISTLPLNCMLDLAGVPGSITPDPFTSVLVLNIGAIRGVSCSGDHWLYTPHSRSGFHRVGFYSNVSSIFLPASSRCEGDRVSLYVERSFRGGERPDDAETERYARAVVAELQDWGFIKAAEVVDPNWINEAYTWSWPDSPWRGQALQALESHDIFPVGRYARWNFQGIADSIRDGFLAGAALKE